MIDAKYCKWLQGISLVFCVAALFFGGLKNPMMGFPIAILVMIVFEIITPKAAYPNKQAQQMAYGSLYRGGIRRGLFIKEMFYVAILLAFVWNGLRGNERFMWIYASLGISLTISCIASEIEAYWMRRAMATDA